MKILAIDTATEACSAALNIDGEITSEYQLAPREHTQLILNMIESLLADSGLCMSDLDALAFGRGPGSFTGVRIATGVIHGIAFARDLPVVPVSTLASIAQSTYNDHQVEKVVAGIDARMGGVYWGCYQLANNGLMQLKGTEQVSPPGDVFIPEGQDSKTPWVGSGSAWKPYKEELITSLNGAVTKAFDDYFPSSASIVQLAAYEYQQGNAVDAAKAQPIYLRNDVAKKAAQQK